MSNAATQNAAFKTWLAGEARRTGLPATAYRITTGPRFFTVKVDGAVWSQHARDLFTAAGVPFTYTIVDRVFVNDGRRIHRDVTIITVEQSDWRNRP